MHPHNPKFYQMLTLNSAQTFDLSLNCHFSSNGLLHELSGFFRVVRIVRLQEHQFCDSTFHRHIPPTDDAGLLQMIAAVVSRHFHSSLQTLTDVDNDLPVGRTFLQGMQQPRRLWRVAAAEGPHHDRFQVGRMDNMTDEVFTDTREEREDDHVVVQTEMRHHRLVPLWRQYALVVIDDVHAGIYQMGIVKRFESIEFLSALLRGTIASQQMGVEIDAHLWY